MSSVFHGASLEVSDHSSVGEPVFSTVDLLSERVAGFPLAVSGSFSPDFLPERVVSCLDDFGPSTSVAPPFFGDSGSLCVVSRPTVPVCSVEPSVS
jgi:hypothetical protein